MLITEAIEQFVHHLKYEKRQSVHTMDAYANDLAQMAQYMVTAFDIREIEAVRSVMMRSWMASLKDEGLESRSVNRKLSSLKSLFRFLQKREILSSDPTEQLESLRIRKQLPRFADANALKTYMDENVQADNWDLLNERTMLQLLYETGIRRGELVALKVQHVDLRAGILKVLGKGSKERLIPIGPALANLLQGYHDACRREWPEMDGRDSFFINEKGKPVSTGYVYRIIRRALEQITSVEQKSPHLLRHSFATHLLNNGADINAIKELLGHASLAATQVYTHNSVEKLKEVFRQAHPKA